MLSSGIRVVAWDWLKWNHIVPIERDIIVVAAKIVAYTGEWDQYFSFITSEAYHALKQWMALTPPELVKAHLNLNRTVMDSLRKEKWPIIKNTNEVY